MMYLVLYLFVALFFAAGTLLRMSSSGGEDDMIWQEVIKTNPGLVNKKSYVFIMAKLIVCVACLLWPVGVPFLFLIGVNEAHKNK